MEGPAGERPHLPERRLDLLKDLDREMVFEKGAENYVALERVAESGGEPE